MFGFVCLLLGVEDTGYATVEHRSQTYCFHPFPGSFDVFCFQLSPFLRPLLYHKLKSVVLSFNAFFLPYHWPKTRRVTCDKLGDRAIKHLLNSVIAKYNNLPRRSIACLSFRHQQKIDLLATDKIPIFCYNSANNC